MAARQKNLDTAVERCPGFGRGATTKDERGDLYRRIDNFQSWKDPSPRAGSGPGKSSGFIRGGADGIHEGGADAAFLQFVDAFDGGSPGTGDHVLEGAGVELGFEDHFAGANERLCGEVGGGLTGQSGGDGTVAEGFDDEEGVGGSAPAETGDGIEEGLLDAEGDADGAEELLGGGLVLGGGAGAGGEGGGGSADKRRGVGHDADDADAWTGAGFEPGEGDAGGDGEQEVIAGERGADFVEERSDLVWFDREDEDFGAADDFEVGWSDEGAGFALETGAGGFEDVACGESGRGDETGLEPAAGEGRGHFSGAEKTDREGLSHGWDDRHRDAWESSRKTGRRAGFDTVGWQRRLCGLIMFHIALKMLIGDRAKYLMLVGGLTFSSLLMTQQCAVFFGLLSWTTSHLRNMQAKVWVVDRKVEQVNEVKALRDTDVGRVRSVSGVGWAVPLFTTILQCKLADGNFKPILIVGLDSTTLVGRPAVMISGRLEDVRLPNAVIIDDLAVKRLSVGRPRPLQVGDTFEVNDKEARVVGICKADRHFFGYPYVFTTYEQGLLFAPKVRKMLSMVLAEPAPGWDAEQTARAIERETRMKAYTEEEFFWATIWWYFRNTGIPASFGTTIILGIVVGVAVCGQTFYTFVLENLRYFGALKAMGAGNGLIAMMMLLQAWTVGFIGYGVGVGLTALFGLAVLEKGQPPFLMPYQLPLFTLVVILMITTVAALFGIRKIAKLEPAMVFRG